MLANTAQSAVKGNQKKNFPGYGIEYEYLVPAYFALKLNSDPQVEDFLIRTNARDFGNVDDVIVSATLKNNLQLKVAIQLKHKDGKTKKICPTNFEAKGDFNLEKYCKAYIELAQEQKTEYHFILYTNANFDPNDMTKVPNFKMCPGIKKYWQTLFDTSETSSVYKFEVTGNTPDNIKGDFNDFFNNFTLCTNQNNYQQVKNNIRSIIKNKNVAHSYEDLFRNWHQGNFTNKTMDKTTINIHLVDAFSSIYLIKTPHFLTEHVCRKIIKEFDVIIMNEKSEEFVKCLKNGNFENYFDMESLKDYMQKYKLDVQKIYQNPNAALSECILRLAKEYKFIDKNTNEVNDDLRVKLIFYFFEKMLVLNFEDTLCKMLQLYQQNVNKLNFIMVGENIELPPFLNNFKVLETLEDLLGTDEVLYQEVTKNCKLSFQGQHQIILDQLIQKNEEILPIISVKELFRMMNGDFTVERTEDHLPNCYIPREISIKLLNIQTVLKFAQDKTNLFIINFGDYFNDVRSKFDCAKIEICSIFDQVENEETPTIRSTQDEYNVNMYQKLERRFPNKIIYFLKMIRRDGFILEKGRKDVHSLKKYSSLTNNFEEKDIHPIFTSPINSVVAQPGMGKSTMMIYLTNTSPPDIWSIKIDLKAHNSFLKEIHPPDEILTHLLKLDNSNAFSTKLKRALMRKNKIVLYLDGLDELESVSIENILDHLEKLTSFGIRIWISFRENLEERVEKKLGKFSVHIITLNERTQRCYIENRLKDVYSEEEIQKIIKQIFASSEIVTNQKVLGVPLELYIVTEIFLNNKKHSNNSEDNLFILTKLYRAFFIGRYQHSLQKYSFQYSYAVVEDLEEYLEKYEIPALQILFSDELLDQLELDFRRSQRFLEKIEKEKDVLGIIVNVNNEGKAVFEHYTFAEYFACVFLFNNFAKARILEEHLFSDKYSNLMLIFNIMLSAAHPLHLAIIYKNVEQIEKHFDDEHDVYDEGGRNPLHVAIICGTKSNTNFSDERDIEKCLVSENYNRQNQKIIEMMSEKFSAYEKDTVFDKNAIHFALLKENLFVLEKILNHHGMTEEVFKNIKKFNIVRNPKIAFVATVFGYLNILSIALDKKHSPITKIKGNFFSCFWEVFVILSEKVHLKQCEIADLLKNFGVVISVSALYSIVKQRNFQLTKFVLEKVSVSHLTASEKNAVMSVARECKEIEELLRNNGFESHQTKTLEVKTSHHLERMEKALFRDTERKNKEKQFERSKIQFDIQEDLERALFSKTKTEHNKKQGKINEIQSDIAILERIKAAYCKEMEEMELFESKDKINAAPKLDLNSESLLEEGEPPHSTHKKQVHSADIVKVNDINNKNELGETQLIIAAQSGDLEKCSSLLKNGADRNIDDLKGNTALHYAVRNGNNKIVKLLLQKDCINESTSTTSTLLDVQNGYGKSPLLIATENGNYELFCLLLDSGANPYVTDSDGRTLLHFAAISGNIQIIESILDNVWSFDKCFDINVQDIYARTPLRCIIPRQSNGAVEFLISRGADTKHIFNVFFYVLHQKNWRLILENMIFQGFDVNGKYQKTPLSLAFKKGDINLVKFLLEKGAKAQDLDAFDEAIQKSNWQYCLECLFSHGLSLKNLRSDRYVYIIEKIINSRQLKKIEYLLERKGSVDLVYVLHAGVLLDDYQMVTFSLNRNSDINARNDEGETTVYVAAKQKNFKMMKFLIERGADVNSLTLKKSFIWENMDKYFNVNIIEFLLTNNADPNIENGLNETPLYFAIKSGKLDIVDLLIKADARLDHFKVISEAIEKENYYVIKKYFRLIHSEYTDKEQASLFFTASKKGNCDIIDYLLLKQGFEIDTCNEEKETALLMAARHNKMDAVELLIVRGADVNVYGKNGERIWDYLQHFNEHLKELIYSKNFDLDRIVVFDKTPLYYAIETEDTNAIETLLKDRHFTRLDHEALLEATMITNAGLLDMLKEKTDFEIRKKWVDPNILRKRRSDKFSKIKINVSANVTLATTQETIEEIENNCYKMLHFGVYTGDTSYVQELVNSYIELDCVDTYNKFYPLHFATQNGTLDPELLIKITEDIRKLYDTKEIWKLKDMRRYVLERYPLGARSRRKHKYAYLTEECKAKLLDFTT